MHWVGISFPGLLSSENISPYVFFLILILVFYNIQRVLFSHNYDCGANHCISQTTTWEELQRMREADGVTVAEHQPPVLVQTPCSIFSKWDAASRDHSPFPLLFFIPNHSCQSHRDSFPLWWLIFSEIYYFIITIVNINRIYSRVT